MRFTACTVIAALACDSAFGFGGFSSTFSGNQFSATATRKPVVSGRGAMSMDLSDLESKLFTPAPAPSKQSKVAPAPKAAPPAPKPAPKMRGKKVEPKLEVLAPEPEPTPVAIPEPKVKSPAKKVTYDLPKAEKKSRTKTTKTEKLKSETPKVGLPKFELPKAKAPSRKLAEKAAKSAPIEPANPLAGVVLGSAPLLVAPLLALGAGRGLLTKTKARRDELQKEVEVVKAKRAQKIVAETDGAGLAKALGLLGAAGASLAIIVAAPFAGSGPKPVAAPTSAKPAMTRAAPEKSAKVSKNKGVVTPKKVRSVKTKKSASGYNFDFDDTTPAQTKSPAKVPAPVSPKATAQEKSTKVEAEVDAKRVAELEKKQALDNKTKAEADAKAKAKTEEETKAKVAAENKAQAKAKAEADAQAEGSKAKASAEAEAKALASAKDKAADEAKAAALAKEKSAADASAAADAAAKANAKVAAAKEDAKAAEAKTAAVKTEPAKTPATVGSGIGVVKGSESGGRVLPAETIDASTLDFLKSLNKN